MELKNKSEERYVKEVTEKIDEFTGIAEDSGET